MGLTRIVMIESEQTVHDHTATHTVFNSSRKYFKLKTAAGNPPQAVGPDRSRYRGGGAWCPEQVEGVLAHRTFSARAAGGVG